MYVFQLTAHFRMESTMTLQSFSLSTLCHDLSRYDVFYFCFVYVYECVGSLVESHLNAKRANHNCYVVVRLVQINIFEKTHDKQKTFFAILYNIQRHIKWNGCVEHSGKKHRHSKGARERVYDNSQQYQYYHLHLYDLTCICYYSSVQHCDGVRKSNKITATDEEHSHA